MKQRVYETNAEYIESMMKQFKLVDMREQCYYSRFETK